MPHVFRHLVVGINRALAFAALQALTPRVRLEHHTSPISGKNRRKGSRLCDIASATAIPMRLTYQISAEDGKPSPTAHRCDAGPDCLVRGARATAQLEIKDAPWARFQLALTATQAVATRPKSA